jgi:hypothetical protein
MLRNTFDGDDELGDHREYFGTAFLKHIENSLDGKEAIGVLLFTDTFEEDWEVMMIVKLLDLHLPVDAKLGAVLYGYRKVATVVESAELAGWDRPAVKGTSSGFLGSGLFLGFVETHDTASDTLTFL